MRERDLGMVFVDGPGFTNESANIRTELDGLFFRWETYRSGKAHGGVEGNRPLGYAGVVDWILEVVSPSSVRKDRERLREKYVQAGVSEYWIVDARDDVIEFDIHVLTDVGYRVQPVVDGWRRSDVFGASFRLECAVNATGRRQFTLRVR